MGWCKSLGGARVWDRVRVWECEGTARQGSGRGQKSGMVQEPRRGQEQTPGRGHYHGRSMDLGGAGTKGKGIGGE